MSQIFIVKILLFIITWSWMWTGTHHWLKSKNQKGFKQFIYGPIVWMGIIYMFLFNR